MLVVVIGIGATVQADITAQHGVGQRVALGLDLPVAVDEALPCLGGVDGIEHDAGGAGGGVLHTHGHGHAGSDQTMLLVLDRARANRNVGQ